MTELVACPPFSARLLESACVARWRTAQNTRSDLACTACRACPLGRERAGSEAPTVASRYTVIQTLKINTRPRLRIRCACGRERTISEERWRHAPPYACRTCAVRAQTPVRLARVGEGRYRETEKRAEADVVLRVIDERRTA